MRKKLRKINKLLGKKNSTSTVKEIKPKVLSNIFAADNTEKNPELKEIGKKLSMMLFKFDEKKAKTLRSEEREEFYDIIQKIAELNNDYVGGKRMGQSQSMGNSGLIAPVEPIKTRSSKMSEQVGGEKYLDSKKLLRQNSLERKTSFKFPQHEERGNQK